jgi:CelD/BcsL family acetyltransferase involved in cellulose biosynthesis
MPSMTLSRPADLDAVGASWEALEAEADASFFQSWRWVGCLAAERFADPVLLDIREQGRLRGLALFNRRTAPLSPDSLFLNESGIAALDHVFTEHNGPLLARDAGHLLGPCLAACLGASLDGRRRGRRLLLGGVDDTIRAAAAALPALLRPYQPSRVAPWLDLAAMRGTGGDYLAGLSANTRYQLRRSDRRYAAAGAITLERAGSIEQAHDMLDRLGVLHQAAWTARGLPGAFANPNFRRFHRELIARAHPRGEIDLLCIAAGGTAIGYLYNFRFRNRIATYQSGFDYAAADAHQKPGLTCHHRAIAWYLEQGLDAYDFLAGEDRYKSSLANATATLHWLELTPRRSARALLSGLRDRLGDRMAG